METKQNKSSQVVLITVVTLIGLGTMFVSASDKWWNPPGPTMKSLDEVEARIPIKTSDVPLVISSSGSYYLTETINFSEPNTNGITIEANDVTIDLNGYALIGPGKAVGSSGNGIYACADRATVLNGSILHWRNKGVHVTGRTSQVGNIKVSLSGGTGIYLQGYSHLVKDCTVSENGYKGIYVDAHGCTVIDNTAFNNQSYGIDIGPGDQRQLFLPSDDS